MSWISIIFSQDKPGTWRIVKTSPLLRIKNLIDTCVYLHKHLEIATNGFRDPFRQELVNTRYFHSTLVSEIERQDQAGVRELVEGKYQDQIPQELSDLQ